MQRHAARLAGVKRARAAAFDILTQEVLPSLEAGQAHVPNGSANVTIRMDAESLAAELAHIRAAHRRLLERRTESAAASAGAVRSGAGGDLMDSRIPPVSLRASVDATGEFARSPLSAPPSERPLSLLPPPPLLPLPAAHVPAANIDTPSISAAEAAADARNRQFDLQMAALESRQLKLQHRAPPQRRGLVGGWGGLAADLAAADAAAAAQGGAFSAPVSSTASGAHGGHSSLESESSAQEAATVSLGVPPGPALSSSTLATGLLAAALKATRGIVASTLAAGGGVSTAAPAGHQYLQQPPQHHPYLGPMMPPQTWQAQHAATTTQGLPQSWQAPSAGQPPQHLLARPAFAPQHLQVQPRVQAPLLAAPPRGNFGAVSSTVAFGAPMGGSAWSEGSLQPRPQLPVAYRGPSLQAPPARGFARGIAGGLTPSGGSPVGGAGGASGGGRGTSATLPAWMTGPRP